MIDCKLSIIIVSYNTKTLTLQALKSSVKAINSTKILQNRTEIFVVDNHSQDNSAQACTDLLQKLHFPHYKILANRKNLGFAQANNQAIKIARGKYILLLNSDVIVHKESLKLLVTAMENNEIAERTANLVSSQAFDKLGILSATLLNPDGSIQNQGGSLPSLGTITAQMLFLDDIPFLGKFFPSTQHTGMSDFAFATYDENTSTLISQGWVAGTAMLLRHELIDNIGLLDGNIFMYGEDQEYCIRARNHHWDVAIHPKAKITHFGSASSSSRNAILGEFKGYLYIFKKHMPTWQLPILKFVLYLGALLRQIIYTLGWQKEPAAIYREAKSLLK